MKIQEPFHISHMEDWCILIQQATDSDVLSLKKLAKKLGMSRDYAIERRSRYLAGKTKIPPKQTTRVYSAKGIHLSYRHLSSVRYIAITWNCKSLSPYEFLSLLLTECQK